MSGLERSIQCKAEMFAEAIPSFFISVPALLFMISTISFLLFFPRLNSKFTDVLIDLPILINERLVDGLENIISLNQAGLVKGNSIVENILVTQEIISTNQIKNQDH
ncbi:hypothetical protein H5410_026951 [Solanum commersonii]|uniref:Uncharacterized protein n=1 Tax=Solanum commersonii TaxID=4109 RepID=A0A9J5YXM4_SOLCO|nr:hypothetical protein H5410_026951 [Solanum commersonii]